MAITLKAARINAGFTQAQAAERLGLSTSTIVGYESGKRFPTTPTIKKIEELYQTQYSDIFFLPNKSNKNE